MKIIEVASVLQRKTHYNQSGQALLPPLWLRQKGLVPATSGLLSLRDFLSIEFRQADIPVWLNAIRERQLWAPRPLRLRLRCQRGKRCRSKVHHKCRPCHQPGSLASGGQDCGRCPLRVQFPQICFRLLHCLGRIDHCGCSLPPTLWYEFLYKYACVFGNIDLKRVMISATFCLP